jgi:DNA-binding response OmpR family regulator
MADILVVDDDSSVAELLREFLELEGHRVRLAADGRAGLEALDESLPDLVILDVEMPGLSGPAMAYRMFVENFGREKVPVLLASGYVELPQIVKGVGTPYFVSKPCSLAVLRGVVERALREHVAPRPDPRLR